MATLNTTPTQSRIPPARSAAPRRWRPVQRVRARVGDMLRGPMAFWRKVQRDWIFHLAALLAYNLLLSSFPIVLVLLAVAILVLNNLSAGAYDQLLLTLKAVSPHGGAAAIVGRATYLAETAHLFLLMGIGFAIYGGSRLFVVLENCFGLIFRLRGRNLIYQNIMAVGMFLLYAILVPLIVLASAIPAAVVAAAGKLARSPLVFYGIQVLGVLVSLAFAMLFLGLIYLLVPNRPIRHAKVWPGALAAAILLVAFQVGFTLFGSITLDPLDLGAAAAYLVLLLACFYYFALVILLGAEINSWASSQREAQASPARLMHEVHVHTSTEQAAGPTAGQPREDVQHRKGAAAMRKVVVAEHHEFEDHSADMQPPRPLDSSLHGEDAESDIGCRFGQTSRTGEAEAEAEEQQTGAPGTS